MLAAMLQLPMWLAQHFIRTERCALWRFMRSMWRPVLFSILIIALLSYDAIKHINTVIEQSFVHDNIITQMSGDTRVKVSVESHPLYDTIQGFLYSHQTCGSVTSPQRSQTHTHTHTDIFGSLWNPIWSINTFTHSAFLKRSNDIFNILQKNLPW